MNKLSINLIAWLMTILAIVLGIVLGLTLFVYVPKLSVKQNNVQSVSLPYLNVQLADINQVGTTVEVEGLGIARKFKLLPVKGTGGYVYGSTFAHRGYGSTDISFCIGIMCEEGGDAKPQLIIGATHGEIQYETNKQTGEQECFIWARKLTVSNPDGSKKEIWAMFHF